MCFITYLILLYLYILNLHNYGKSSRLGAGISGHTAALHLRKNLNKSHEIIVVSPNSNYQWVPSNIWVGLGLMTPEQVKFELAPVYKKSV